MKRIYFNKPSAEAAIRGRQLYYDQVNELGAALAKEGIPLTNEILGQFMRQGTPYIAALLVDDARAQFEKTGMFLNSAMMAGIQQNAGSVARQFEKFHLSLQQAQQKSGISHDQVSIMDDGKAVLNDGEKKEIEKQHSYYLKKEDEPLYEKLTEIADSLNGAFKELQEHNQDLFLTLKKILAEGSFSPDLNMVLHPRGDTCLILNKENKIEPNPAIFS